jgi:hypothetical protein
VKLASALDQPQDSCLDDGSGRIALLVQTSSAPKNLLSGQSYCILTTQAQAGVLMIMTVTAS